MCDAKPDRPAAMPPLTGERTTDMDVFAAMYERVMAELPDDAAAGRGRADDQGHGGQPAR
ncbi:hypothetical protein [Microtetraspora malaysiensis]|uniref:hypothetical protein n=1 Tax=Microtetraspora malaysiensis TaxID=161358 RepID=UPI003D928C7B